MELSSAHQHGHARHLPRRHRTIPRAHRTQPARGSARRAATGIIRPRPLSPTSMHADVQDGPRPRPRQHMHLKPITSKTKIRLRDSDAHRPKRAPSGRRGPAPGRPSRSEAHLRSAACIHYTPMVASRCSSFYKGETPPERTGRCGACLENGQPSRLRGDPASRCHRKSSGSTTTSGGCMSECRGAV